MLNLLKLLFGSGNKRKPAARAKANSYSRPYTAPNANRAQSGRGYASAPEPQTGEQLARPSRPGTKTGYEPNALREYHAPISINALGIAGLGLFDSSFSKQSVYSGQLGEVGFYKVLCKEGLIDNFSSYWSVAMPGDRGVAVADEKFKTDVDCVVVQGNTIYLFDLKYYASGDVTWHSPDGTWLLCKDNASGKQVGKPRKMSRNMAMAQERFPKIFRNHQVRSFVVLIPTNAGIGQVAPGTAWPGNIPLITLPNAVDMLRNAPSALADDVTSAALAALVQD